MGTSDESDKYLGEARELFGKGRKKEALEKMLDSARASGMDMNHIASEHGVSKSQVPLGGYEKSSSKSFGWVWGLGILCAMIGASMGGGGGFFFGGIIGAVIGHMIRKSLK